MKYPRRSILLTLIFVIGFILVLIGSILYTQFQSKKNILELREANKIAASAFEINNRLQELIYHIESAEIYAREAYAVKKTNEKSIEDTLKIINNHLDILKKLTIQKHSQLQLTNLLELVDKKMFFIDSFMSNFALIKNQVYDSKKMDQLLNVSINDSLFYSALKLQQNLENDLKQTFVQSNNYSNKVLRLNTLLSIIVILAVAILSTLIIKKLLNQISLIVNLGKEKERADKSAKIKEQFLANMSHEIRTPINAVIGFANLLKKSNLDANQKQFVDLIYNSGDNLLAVVNDILDISKIEAGMMRISNNPFNLRELCTSLEMMFFHKVKEKKLSFSMNYDENIPDNIVGDEDRLNQVLINLINNAIKFTKEGGIVNVGIKLIERKDNKISLQFIVNDTGIGISKDKIKTIFERFEQADTNTSREYGGTGLGLAIVKQIINIQNGSITVDSTLGYGSTFTINLDFEIANPSDLNQNIKSLNVPQNKFDGCKILVAEDNNINQILIKFILKQWNLQYDLAESGIEVLQLIQENNYDLILMDIQMPIMDGYEASINIRKKYNQSIPIIAMTAHVLPTEKQKCIDAGMNDYISKPINENELFQLIKKYVKNSSIEVVIPQEIIQKKNPLKYIDISYLENIFAGDKEFIIEIMEQFKLQFPAELQKLKQNILLKNKESVLAVTHHMKTTVSSLSVKTPLKPMLDSIDEYVNLNLWNNTEQQLGEIINIEQEVIKEVNSIIDLRKMYQKTV